MSLAQGLQPVFKRPRILCIDDDVALLEGLRRQLHRHFETVSATSGEHGLIRLRADGPFSVIMTDMRMPGMNGAEVLAQARLLEPDTVRVLLTGQADIDNAVSAVNDGNVFRFLIKPCPPDILLRALGDAVAQYRLINAARELLEQTLRGSVSALLETLSLANPMAFARAGRISTIVVEMIKAVDAPDAWCIEVSAMLSQIGTVVLPPDVIAKIHGGLILTRDEAELVDRLPEMAEQLLAHIPRLEEVREIIKKQRLPYSNGTATPTVATINDTPLGARMLNLATALETLETRGLSRADALEVLAGRAFKYDPALLGCLRAADSASPDEPPILEVKAYELTSNMTIARDVTDSHGRLLVGRGYRVTRNLIDRIDNWKRTTIINEPIYVTVST
jgi:response regulator RpfG family c-di-GMP phosphodiesterase